MGKAIKVVFGVGIGMLGILFAPILIPLFFYVIHLMGNFGKLILSLIFLGIFLGLLAIFIYPIYWIAKKLKVIEFIQWIAKKIWFSNHVQQIVKKVKSADSFQRITKFIRFANPLHWISKIMKKAKVYLKAKAQF
ncbi:hypothetical protein D7X33_32655 [Butyricicoccus sp. 1XD8-22]|nr:hypothetical protein D7X33_32655 [Butyricicoccus sp. 1XD8-22]